MLALKIIIMKIFIQSKIWLTLKIGTSSYHYSSTVGCLFSKATNFVNGLKKKVNLRKQFSQIYFSLQSAIRIMIGFLLIFRWNKFRGSSKIHKIREICTIQKRRPVVLK